MATSRKRNFVRCVCFSTPATNYCSDFHLHMSLLILVMSGSKPRWTWNVHELGHDTRTHPRVVARSMCILVELPQLGSTSRSRGRREATHIRSKAATSHYPDLTNLDHPNRCQAIPQMSFAHEQLAPSDHVIGMKPTNPRFFALPGRSISRTKCSQRSVPWITEGMRNMGR